jgi:hypothetical protein
MGFMLEVAFMNKFKSLIVASAALVGSFAGSANATPVTFDFSLVKYAVTPTINYVDGSGLAVEASTPVGGVSATLVYPVRPTNSGGLGVTSGPGDSPIVDGVGLDDLLNLTFNHKVKIISAVFSEIDFSDDFNFIVDGSNQGHFHIPLISHLYNFSGEQGHVFGFGAGENNDDFKLKSITVSAVPLPPALLLFVSGLFGIGLLGRRRNKLT